MSSIADRLSSLRPTLHWRQASSRGGLDISAGTTWVTLAADGCSPVRIRGEGLNLLRAGLETILDPADSVCSIALAPGLEATVTPHTVTHPATGQMVERELLTLNFIGGASKSEVSRSSNSVVDLLQWLQLLAGEEKFPLGSRYCGATLRDGELVVKNGQKLSRIPVEDPPGVQQALLAPAGTIRNWPDTGLNISQKQRCAFLAHGRTQMMLSRAAAAHLVATLEGP